ncbi:hypothetical protein K523DRAFT_318082 [Schizophyllum commune Tattone D]|nr:hypothetical protein K523DRAFT_318082 [Schizophyllum commune Tattone D]
MLDATALRGEHEDVLGVEQGANASPVLQLLPGIIARRLDKNFDILLRKSVYPPRSTCTPSGAPWAGLVLP